jgi:hypothetical protein
MARRSSSGVSTEMQPGIIQRKLQRAYQEKELLLSEVQTLRQQLKSMKSKSKSVDTPMIEHMEGWNHLLEANMKSGTLACLWCLKSQYLKMIALAFGKWKCVSACAFAVSRARQNLPSGSSKHDEFSSELNDESYHRRREILTNARKVISSPSSLGPQNNVPIWARPVSKGKRSYSAPPRRRGQAVDADRSECHPSSFENSLRRSTPSHRPESMPPRRQAKLSSTISKKLPNFATPTYSSLKMFNQGSPTTSFKNQSSNKHTRAFQAYIDSRPLNDITNANHVPSGEERGGPLEAGNGTDDVSEISSDDDPKEVSPVRAPPPRSSSVRVGYNKVPTPTKPESVAARAQSLSRSRSVTTSAMGNVRIGRVSNTDSALKMGNSPPISGFMAPRPGKSKMDKAQMRLLYGVIDDQGKRDRWSQSLRFEGSSSSISKNVARQRSRNQRPLTKFKL